MCGTDDVDPLIPCYLLLSDNYFPVGPVTNSCMSCDMHNQAVRRSDTVRVYSIFQKTRTYTPFSTRGDPLSQALCGPTVNFRMPGRADQAGKPHWGSGRDK